MNKNNISNTQKLFFLILAATVSHYEHVCEQTALKA